MRKLFVFISALMLAVTASAADQYPDPSVSNSLSVAVNNVGEGETIWLDDATPYVNHYASKGGDDYTILQGGKHITIRAIAGKSPVIKYEVPFRVIEAVNAKFIGVKFDGTDLSHYSNYFHFYDAADNVLEFEDCEFTAISKYIFHIQTDKKVAALVLKNCNLHDNTNRGILNEGTITELQLKDSEFKNFTNYSILDNYTSAVIGSIHVDGCEFANNDKTVINGESSSRAEECLINDCYFHDNVGCAVCFKKTSVSNQQTCSDLRISNSTFSNINVSADYYSVIDIKPGGSAMTDSIKVIVDHCTFYNLTTKNHDYSAIRPYKLSDVTISNCIFAHPTAEVDVQDGPQNARRATCCYGGTINNCLTWNLMEDASRNAHRQEGGQPVLSGNFTANPLFTDPNAATPDFSFPANWSTGSISPACETATDGSNLGDPRWNRDNEVLPSSSIASSYDLLSTKAQLTGDVKLNASNHIEYKGTSTPGTVKWKLHIERACMISAVADREAESTSGCQLTLTVKDADGNTVGSPLNAAATYNDSDIPFPGTIFFSEAGGYTFILTNSTANSGAILEKITLSYVGGAVQDISSSANTTLNVADALFTAGFTRADGQVSPGSWKPEGQPLGYVKWNIATSETKFYNLTLNFSSTNAHSMVVNIYEDEEASPVATVSESYTSTTGTLTISDRVNLVGGKNYVVKVTNPTSGSQAKVTNIVFAPVVAVATELPNTLDFSNAVLSEKAHITDGMLYFNEIGDSNPQGQWAQWDVTTDHDGLFLFTMNVTSENEQSYKITIKDNSENVLDFYETSPGSGNREIKHYFALGTGTYFVKVENTRSYSKGHLVSFAVSEPDNVVTIDEAATDNTSWVEKVVAKEAEGPLYDVQIIRTIKAGMYNTFCLPFEVSSSQCKDIFGSDVQIRTLEEATVEEGDFVLNLNFKTASDIYPGTPVLIQTSRDIVNPVFTGVKFTITTPSATTKTNANYTGTFVKTALEANENILFLGANNKLYFPTATVDIYGMRGWFVIHGSGGASAPKFNGARIVMDDQIATDIELVTSQKPTANSHKLLIDGQLFIIRDGVLHNVTGARVK